MHTVYQSMHKHTARVMVHMEYYLLRTVYIYRILHCKQSVSFYELAECPLTSAAAKEGVSIHLTPLALIATLRYYA